MKRTAALLTAGSALLMLTAGPSFAEDSSEGALIVNGQVNLAPVFSELNATIETVEGDASAQASAAGNAVTIITNTDTTVANNQYQGADVGAWMYAKVGGVGGDVSLTSAAVCNSASVSTDPRLTKVDSVQKCTADDPYATAIADVSNVGGLVGINATAVANQIEVDSDAARFPVNNWQENRSGTFANVNARVNNVGGVGISASAVGNTAQILHLGQGAHGK